MDSRFLCMSPFFNVSRETASCFSGCLSFNFLLPAVFLVPCYSVIGARPAMKCVASLETICE